MFHLRRKWGWWWNVIVCLLVLSWLLLALFVDFRWSVKISWIMGVLEEEDGAVVGVSWPLPSDPLSILNAHFRL